ncbi:MAG: WGR domain-containing protein, partial [Polyangiaceae bacterium]|nr:WGR domain-containing protein [Polyangiaceae bacterium]
MRRFEFVQGTSAKFWSADVEGATFIVVYGRLGTPGQRKEKAFPSEDAARRELDKKIAEKLREGYHEVSAAASAPTGAKGAAAASARLELPPRGRTGQITAARVAAATDALKALDAARGRRSWALAWRTRIARRALEAIAGVDPASDPALAAAFDAVMARVVAARSADRLPLGRALELLWSVDAAAFARALGETWSTPPPG